MFSEYDKSMMQRALELAEKGVYTTSPNPNVGCVITKNEQIIGEGYHFQAGEPHAEVYALRAAGINAMGATAYVTLEPCSHYGKTPPCADALIEAGINRVVVAMVDPNPEVAGRGITRLENAGIKVAVGLFKEEAEKLNKGFIKRMTTGMPYVQLKLAASLDGRTALANGESKWITGPEARKDVQVFRAQACAILSTRATVKADDPSLNVRFDELPSEIQANYDQENLRQPLRVILDTQGRLSTDANLFSLPGNILLITSNQEYQAKKNNLEVVCLAQSKGKIDLEQTMRLLAKRGVNLLWVEAGSELATSLLNEKLVDEIILYQAPKLMGADARSLTGLNGFSDMLNVPEFELSDLRQISKDIRVILHPVKVENHK